MSRDSDQSRISLLVPYLGEEEIAAAGESIRSTWMSGNGPKGQELEKRLADFLGVKHVLLVTNCTSAMHLALMALGIHDGEVVVPNYTFTSTGLASVLVGARPALAEVEFDTANIDTRILEQSINKNTRAIIPVHYAGLPCNMDEVMDLARKYDLVIVEDAAQAIGSRYRGKMAGTIGDAGCFSFHSVKNISCGEGGALVTNRDDVFERARIMRDKGTDKYSFDIKANKGFYEFISEGHNFMLSDILAAILLEQFKKLEKINALRKSHALKLIEGLKNVDRLGTPGTREDRESNWHLFPVRTPVGKTREFIEGMDKRGITTNTQYVPLHMNRYYQSFGYEKGDFPESEKLYESLVRLPMHPSLTDSDIARIIESATEVMSSI